MTTPLLQDTQFKTQFVDGDRVIVRVAANIAPEQVASIKRSLCKSTKAQLRVIVVNCLQIRMMLFRGGRPFLPLSIPKHAELQPAAPNVASINLTKVVLFEGDVILVRPSGILNKAQRDLLRGGLARWAGDGVTVHVESQRR